MSQTDPTRPGALRVCGLAGSLRRGSYNRALLRAAGELAPAGMTLEIFDLAPLPFYNADVEAAGLPEPVRALKRAIGGSDALLLATPEYSYGVSGVLKNALDWASRPPRDSALAGKPTAILGASPGFGGTARGQAMLRQVLAGTLTPVLLTPEVYVARAQEKFDAEGRLTDEPAREQIRKLLAALGEWARRLGGR